MLQPRSEPESGQDRESNSENCYSVWFERLRDHPAVKRHPATSRVGKWEYGHDGPNRSRVSTGVEPICLHDIVFKHDIIGSKLRALYCLSTLCMFLHTGVESLKDSIKKMRF